MKIFILTNILTFSLLLQSALANTSSPNKYERISRNYDVNKEISPCDDFYEYTCSKVINDFKLPDNRPIYVFSFSDSAEGILSYKKEYFKNLSHLTPTNSKETLLKSVYTACMDVESSKKDEMFIVKKIKDELSKIQGKEEFLSFISKKIVSEYSAFLQVAVMRNQDNSSYTDFLIIPNLMSLPEKSYYDNAELQKDYEEVLTELFAMMGNKDPKGSAKFVFNFEKQFAQDFPTPLELRTLLSTKTKITKDELVQLKNLKLQELLKKIPKNVLIRNITPKSLIFLNDQLEKLSLEELKDLYLALNVKDVVDDSGPTYFNKYFTLKAKYLGGPKTRPDRQENCTNLVVASFPMELDYILTPRIFPNFPRERVVKMAEAVRSQIIKTLNENKWLSKEGKAGAIKKMKTASLYLVSPLNNTQWNFNPSINYSNQEPVQNILRLKHAKTKQSIQELGKKLPKDRWEKGPLEVNAYYNPSFNQFVLPAAILQKPFFDPGQSDLQNMAAMGTVMGHELGHGIDDNGRRYDFEGKLRDWVTPADIEGLKLRTAPLVEQFNKIGHNGALTLGENIGDAVGLTNAFKISFPDYKVGKYPKEKLQEFFLQYGRIWCEVQTDSFKEMRLKTDPHSLGFARTNEQVKQQVGFKEAYSCKNNDPMTLEEDKLISIW